MKVKVNVNTRHHGTSILWYDYDLTLNNQSTENSMKLFFFFGKVNVRTERVFHNKSYKEHSPFYSCIFRGKNYQAEYYKKIYSNFSNMETNSRIFHLNSHEKTKIYAILAKLTILLYVDNVLKYATYMYRNFVEIWWILKLIAEKWILSFIVETPLGTGTGWNFVAS